MGPDALIFKEWAAGEGLMASADIEQLKGRRLAIDAEDYLLTILNSPASREPLLPALGGLPLALQSRIENDIQSFRSAGIEPLFTFNGLDLACRDRASVLRESRKAMRALDQAWKDYDESRGELAVSNFGKACTYRIHHIMRNLHGFLHRLGVMVHTAPYSAAAQMMAYERDDFADAVYGSAACLLYGAEKVITSIDWEARRFFWVELKACLAKTGLNRDQFLELCLLSGCTILSPLPEIDVDSNNAKMQTAKAVMSRAGNDGSSVVAKDEPYQTLFHKARFAIKHPVIITSNGKVEPLNWETGPSDVHEFVGQRLPEEIYHYLSRGLIGPKILNWRTRMEILEIPPLDGGRSQTYHDLVGSKLTPLRAQALALITHSIHRYYQNTDVGLICWFNEGEKQSLNLRDVTQPTSAADSWNVKLDTLPESQQPPADGTILSYAINLLSDDAAAEKTVTTRQAIGEVQLQGQTELCANIIWRFLTDRGYAQGDHKLSSWGKALATALKNAEAAGIADDATDEIIVMSLELIRLDLLNTKQLFNQPPYSGAPIRGTVMDKANTMLISRVAALGLFKHGDIGYTGPLSRHLLAYGQVAAAVRETLRDLVEAHACHMFVSGAADRDMLTTDMSTLATSLPFGKEPDLGLALVVKSYLDELSNDPAKRQDITKWFNHALDVKGDLARMWKVWDAVVAGVQAADESAINSETKKMFTSADEWLKAKLTGAANSSSAS